MVQVIQEKIKNKSGEFWCGKTKIKKTAFKVIKRP